MNRIKEHHIGLAACCLIVSAMCALGIATAQSADIPRYSVRVARVTPDEFAVALPDANGQYVMYDKVQELLANCGGAGATGPWTLETPTQDEPILLCEIKPGIYALRNYTNGQWRNGTSVTPAPLAWARINARTAE